MGHSLTDARKYGNYIGAGGLLWQVCRYQVPPRVEVLQVLMSKVHQGYHLRTSLGKCLSGNGSESAKAAGTPDADDGTQYVGGTGSVGWSVQAGEEWRLGAHSLGRGLRP